MKWKLRIPRSLSPLLRLPLLAGLLALAASSAPAALIAHYTFNDGDLTNDETAAYPLTHVQLGSAAVTINTAGHAVFPGDESTNKAYLESVGPGGASNFTLSFWFRTDQLDQGLYQGLFSNNTNSTAAYSFQIHLDSSGLNIISQTGIALTKPAAQLAANTWYHVVLRKQASGGDQTEFYVTPGGAGSVQLAGSDPLNPGGLQFFRVGVNRNSDKLLRMEMAHVRIYNDATVDLNTLLAEGPAGAVIEQFKPDDAYVAPGETVTLSWTVGNADGVRIDPGPGDVTALTTNGTGSVQVAPSSTTVYTLTATHDEWGPVTADTRVGVGPPRPNILFFLVDDMGTQDTSEPFYYTNGVPVVTALNLQYRTPAMETLADRGMKFTQAYAMPVCTPTRSCLMTGMNSVRHHVTNWTNPDGTETGQNSSTTHNSPADWRRRGMDETDLPLAVLLRDAGYRTILSGKAHFGAAPYFGSEPRNLGFDVNIGGSEIGHPGSYLGTANFGEGTTRPVPDLEEYYGQDIFLTEALTLEMKDAIAQAVDDGAPFYAYMTHYAVHSPFTLDDRFSTNYPSLSSSPLNFATMIEGMDKSLGDLLAHLDALGVAEDTLVVFLGDNGSDAPLGANNSPPLRGKKGTQWEGGIREPLLVGWARPDGSNAFQAALPIAPGSRCDAIVAAFDLFPTLLGVADVPFTHAVDGYDIRPYLAGTPGTHRPQELMIHYPHDHNGDYFTTLRQDDWKLIYYYVTDAFQLYNLAEDIGETSDLASAQPDRVMAMARRMGQLLDSHGAQWPTFEAGGADDPFAMPALPGVDLDDDGLDDNAEDPNRNGLVDPGETDPDKADTDGDLTPDGAETALGTDPLNPASRFEVELALDPAGQVLLTWPSLSGTVFRSESSTNLNGWSMLQEGIPADAGGTSTTYNAGSAAPVEQRFYRVKLQ